ncbi:MAG: hypothetical protein QF922_08140 [SAR324 cluster bacterium]|nr:hypothetical protein [SAR324 cluster bacterium]
MKRFEGRNILITGCCSGIGYDAAVTLKQRGHTVSGDLLHELQSGKRFQEFERGPVGRCGGVHEFFWQGQLSTPERSSQRISQNAEKLAVLIHSLQNKRCPTGIPL